MQALHPTECTVFLMLENSSLWKRLNSCEGQGPSSPQAQSRCWTGAQPEGRQRWSPSPAHPVSSTCWSLVIPSTGFLLGVRLAKLIYEVKKKLSVRMKAWKKTGLDTAGVALGKFLALSKIHTWSQTVNREGSVSVSFQAGPWAPAPPSPHGCRAWPGVPRAPKELIALGVHISAAWHPTWWPCLSYNLSSITLITLVRKGSIEGLRGF